MTQARKSGISRQVLHYCRFMGTKFVYGKENHTFVI